MKKSPGASVKELFESKGKLVEAVQKLATDDLWIDRVNGTKGLGKVSNQKLLRLHELLSDAKQRFGSRQKLVSAILELEKRSKDKGYSSRLEGYPIGRLLDLHGSLDKSSRRRASREKAAEAKPAKAAKVAKAPAKAAKTPAKKAAKKPS